MKRKLKIYNKIFELDSSALLKTLSVVCGIIFGFIFVAFFMELFLSVLPVAPISGTVGKLPMTLLFSSILQSTACGVSGFLISLIVIFISKSRGIETVVFTVLMVAILLVAVKTEFLSSSQPLFFKIYLLSDMILNTVFLFGFAVLGAWLLNKIHRSKIQKAEKGIQ